MSFRVAVALFVGLIANASCATPASTALAGSDLGGGPARDFTLQDGLTGSSVSLSSFRGRAVALTFLYTQCPDACPLTAELLRTVRDRLGSDASRVELVAVSVDPVRDTPQAVRAFSDAHRLSANWHYLIGRPEQLAAVHTLYGVRAASDLPSAPTVAHSDAIFLIDPSGRERTLVHTDESVDALVATLRTLLRGG